jgi:serine/threonine protein kinase
MRAHHPNVARLLGYSINAQDSKEVYFIFESPTNGSLFDALASEEKRVLLTGQRRVKIMFELARVMAYLHKGVVVENSAPITFVHRDLKASNIYLTSEYSIKLMDCGLSSLVKDPVSQSDVAFQLTDGWQVFGSQGYVCPQYASAKVTTYTPPCDVYSFGIVMMELLTGWLQFGNLAKKYQERSVLIGGIDVHAGEAWNQVLEELCDLALSCVQLELTSRPSSDHVFETLKEIYSRLLSTPNASPMKY